MVLSAEVLNQASQERIGKLSDQLERINADSVANQFSAIYQWAIGESASAEVKLIRNVYYQGIFSQEGLVIGYRAGLFKKSHKLILPETPFQAKNWLMHDLSFGLGNRLNLKKDKEHSLGRLSSYEGLLITGKHSLESVSLISILDVPLIASIHDWKSKLESALTQVQKPGVLMSEKTHDLYMAGGDAFRDELQKYGEWLKTTAGGKTAEAIGRAIELIPPKEEPVRYGNGIANG